MTKEFIRALGDLTAAQFPEVTSVNHIHPTDLKRSKKTHNILLLGRAPVIGFHRDAKGKKIEDRWEPLYKEQVYRAPSVREVTGTAGGLTKLSYGINLYVSGLGYAEDFSAPYTLISDFTETYPMPPVGVPLVVDIEVSGDINKDEPEDTELLAVSVLWEEADGTPSIIVFDASALTRPELVSDLTGILTGASELTGHNGKFDFRWLNTLLQIWIYPTDDTMLMHHSMFHGAGEHGLKPLAQRILGAPEWEAGIETHVGKGKANYERIPQGQLCRYNAQDVFWTWMLKKRFLAMLEARPDARRAYALEMEAARMFQDVEAFGMPVDLEYAEYLDGYFTDRYAKALPYLHQVAGQEINPNSPPQIKSWFAARGLKLASTDKDMLTNLQLKGFEPEFISALITCRQVTKAHGTYVKGPVAKTRNGRVHSTFLVHGTTTGRLSCKGPNLQNVPNDDDDDSEEGMPSLRRMYSAPDGWVFVGADYAQAELRVIAELSNDPTMLHDLRAGAPDFFDNMLPSVWPNVDFDSLTKAQRKPYRLKLKRIVYGLNYGRTAWAIANASQLEKREQDRMTEAEAQAIADAYLGRYPGLQDWRASTMEHVYAEDWTTPFGREYQQDVITHAGARRAENMAWAFMPQSIASDICLTAALDLHKTVKKNQWRGHIVATVHDAIYALVPVEEAVVFQATMVSAMMSSAEKLYTRVPFPVDGHIAKHWNEA